MNMLGRILAEARASKGWSRSELARALGAATEREIHRMTMRLAEIEQGQEGYRKLLRRAVAVTGGDCEALEKTIRAIDEEAAARYRAWLYEEVPMVVHYRLMPSVWVKRALEGMSFEEAYAHASGTARDRWLYTALAVNRRLTIWFQAGTGEETRRDERTDGAARTPSTSVGGRSIDLNALCDGIVGAPASLERAKEDACR
jgi:transcriptional regulator with XRE-family HTH domain